MNKKRRRRLIRAKVRRALKAAPPPGIPKDELDDMLEFLNKLRESGVTNMFGAAPYLQREFGLDRREAKKVLTYWMQSY